MVDFGIQELNKLTEHEIAFVNLVSSQDKNEKFNWSKMTLKDKMEFYNGWLLIALIGDLCSFFATLIILLPES